MYETGLLLSSLRQVLGNYIVKKHNNVAFSCPFCNHHKMKLTVDLVTQKWHCWVCDAKGRKLLHLLKKINTSNNIIRQVLEYVNEHDTRDIKVVSDTILLPKCFKPLWKQYKDTTYRHAIKYITGRNIHINDIIRYGIGYCSSGKYQNRIIIPSYDANNRLNYFIARDIFPNSKLKYKNPSVPKDTVIFELFINWKQPIILCEGVFDAIAIRRNAIPLLGKFPSKTLIQRIIENKVTQVYIALDKDAKTDSIKLSKYLMDYGIKTYRMSFQDNDPSELGFNKFWDILNNTTEYSFSQSIRDRLYD